MRNSEVILSVLSLQSVKGKIFDIYRKLYNVNLYESAFLELCDDEVELNEFKPHILELINDIKQNRFRWQKQYVFNQKFKTDSIQVKKDKVLQRVLYNLLKAVYSTEFVENTFGFRQNDTDLERALTRTLQLSQGIEFFIRFDLDQIIELDFKTQTDLLKQVLNSKFDDNRFVNLILNLIRSNYFHKFWATGKTFSGTRVGSFLTELLFSILVSQLDKYIVQTIVSRYTVGKTRDRDKGYRKYEREIRKESLKDNVNWKKIVSLKKQRNKEYPYSKALIKDTEYRRCGYVRYATQCIIPFTGSYNDAVDVQQELERFLHEKFSVDIPIKIYHVRKDPPVTFLKHSIVIQYSKSRRSVNGNPAYVLSNDVLNEFMSRYMKKGYPRERPELTCMKVFDIISQYQRVFSHIVQYYVYIRNKTLLNKLQWVMEESLSKTLAQKLKISVSEVYRKYRSFVIKHGHKYPVIKCTENGYCAYFGGLPLKKTKYAQICDISETIFDTRGSFIDRASKNVCCLCGSDKDVQQHHIHGLKDIEKTYPSWLKMKIALTRKTIPVCRECHRKIHSGDYSSYKL